MAHGGFDGGGSVIRIDSSLLRDAESSAASFGSLERTEAAAILNLVEFERTGAVALTGYIGLTRWLEVEGGMSRADAHIRHRLVRHCARFPLTARALESGTITLPYLRVLVAAASGLADEYEADEARLLALASERDVTTFERAVANWRNRAETAAGTADPARSFAQRGVSWQRGFDGSGHGQFSLDPIAMELLEQALDTPPDPADGIEPPRTLRQRRADALTDAAAHYVNGAGFDHDECDTPSPADQAEAPGESDPSEPTSDPSGPATPRSTPNASNGDNKAETDDGSASTQPSAPGWPPPGDADPTDSATTPNRWAWTQPTGARHGTKTIIDAVVDLATLEGTLPDLIASIRAEFASGAPISDAVLEQLLCDASYRRLIIDGPSIVLDHSSPTADVSVGLRRAIQLRDRHCQFAGCDRPWNWCDVHHLTPRAQGGQTNERNLALVCRYHHTLIHQAGWHLGRDPTTDRLVTTSP